MQRTIRQEIKVEGTGLHTGRPCSVRIRPLDVDSGIQFVKINGSVSRAIPLSWDQVSHTAYATTLGTNGVRFHTVEHLASALRGLHIDNALVEVEGGEIPIADGSSRVFVNLLLAAGLVEQDRPRKAIRVKRPVAVEEDGKRASFVPYDGFRLDYRIHFESPLVRNQSYEFDLTSSRYVDEIAPARTFCMRSEVDRLWAVGLAKGGSLANAVVFENGHVLNPEGLRFQDEPVRHKILDAVGDLALAGCPIKGAFIADRSGHTLNLQLLRALFSSEENYRIEEA